MRAVPPIPIGFRLWGGVALRADEKKDKWDMLSSAFIAAEGGQIVLTGFYPLSIWLYIGTLGIANYFFVRGLFLKMREETIRPDDVRRVVIKKEMMGHCSYHLVVDRGEPIYAVHLFIPLNKGNDKFIIKLFEALLPPEKVTLV
jgi:hypothetical protein